ncbi:MAG TPA: ATP-binding protein [Gemmataceae bacterium]
MPRLIVIRGADEGKQFDLTDDVVGIGRDKANAVHLHDTEVSRRHLELRRTPDGGYRLVDLGSANGTMVNARPVVEAELNPGDHIQLGQTILVFSGGRGSQEPPTEVADKISLIKGQDLGFSSAIIRTIGENEGSAILARPEQAGTEWLRTRLANLAVMYETAQAISHILDLDQLLDRIMELVFRSTEADHGCVMLKNPDTGEFEPKAVRRRGGADRHERIAVSRTIIDHVLRNKEGVLVSDAARDERFKTGQSITLFSLREVICVPMKGRHETVGVLFLDTQSTARELIEGRGEEARAETPAGKFTPDHLALVAAIAHQAALAVEETRYHQALLHAERLAAVGQTIAALSHHIKNDMQGAIFGGEMVNKGLAEGDRELLLKGWRMVEKSQAKIHALVLDMLSYSKEREPAIEPVDLNRLVREVLDVVRGRAEQGGAQLVVRQSPNLPPVPCDPEGIHRALLNVIGNALDAVAEQPKPYIAVQTLLEQDGRWARVIVLDNGPGIEPGMREEIFKPFVSTKGGRGTGLGLAVSRKILREHGGEITVESQVGVGSKFIIRLPMKTGPSGEQTAAETPAPPPPPGEGIAPQ